MLAALWTLPKNNTDPAGAFDRVNYLVVHMAVPESKLEELNVSITGNTVTVTSKSRKRGLPTQEPEPDGGRHVGFSRSLVLPMAVKREGMGATLENGLLTLTLPRARSSEDLG